MENKPVLRAKDVAHILDCCPDDLYQLIHTGEIKAFKVGRLWRFHLQDVMDYQKRITAQSAGSEENEKIC